MAQDIQNALKFPGDHLTKIWKVILNMLGIDFDKLPPDEQKVLKKVLAKSPVIKKQSFEFPAQEKIKTAVVGIAVPATAAPLFADIFYINPEIPAVIADSQPIASDLKRFLVLDRIKGFLFCVKKNNFLQ